MTAATKTLVLSPLQRGAVRTINHLEGFAVGIPPHEGQTGSERCRNRRQVWDWPAPPQSWCLRSKLRPDVFVEKTLTDVLVTFPAQQQNRRLDYDNVSS